MFYLLRVSFQKLFCHPPHHFKNNLINILPLISLHLRVLIDFRCGQHWGVLAAFFVVFIFVQRHSFIIPLKIQKWNPSLCVCVWRGLSEIVSLVHRGMSRVVVESAAFIIYRVVSFDVLWASKQAACLYSLVEDDDIALLGPCPVRLLYLSFFSSIE